MKKEKNLFNLSKYKKSNSRFDFPINNTLLKSKRSQTTIFIIFSLIIILIIISTIVYTNLNLKNSTQISFNQQTNIILEEFKKCLENTYKESINEVSFQGGYFHEPLTEYLKNDLNSIPFYYFGELEYIPQPELIEEQIIVSIDSKKNVCFNLINSSGLGYEYYYELPNVSIKEDAIEIKEKIKLILTKENSTNIFYLNELIKIKSNLLEMNSFSSYITYSYELNNESICLSCFQEIALDKNLIVEIDDSIENILIITITETKENYYPRFYNFAISSTRDLEENKMLPEDSYKISNNTTNEELNFNVSNFKNE